MGPLLLRIDRRTATGFSPFLAIPTILGGASFDRWKTPDVLEADDALVIGIGFAAALLAALVMVRALVAFVSRHGIALFAW
jgi:undecaprenyl-diphosphatase